jgi:hypothetical protein
MIIEKMKLASEEGKTAVEVIADDLLIYITNKIKEDRIKQFTGYLVRIVLENNGFRHVGYGKKAGKNPIFTEGSTYKKIK